MSLFGFGKKKEEEKQVTCCCGSDVKSEETTTCCCGSVSRAETIAGIKVLGAGCKSCHEQYENAQAAVKAMGLSLEVEYITDMERVMEYGVMAMPAIMVNNQVVSMGKVLKASDVEKLLRRLGY